MFSVLREHADLVRDPNPFYRAIKGQSVRHRPQTDKESRARRGLAWSEASWGVRAEQGLEG